MSNSYKLTSEIKEFILNEKTKDSQQSCRSLVPLIERNFSLKLSKSLINSVLKENKLSSLVGRRRSQTPLLEHEELEGVIENGGFFFLKVADINLSLTLHLAQNLSRYFPDLSIL